MLLSFSPNRGEVGLWKLRIHEANVQLIKPDHPKAG